jgi:hypothetical protein
MGSKRYLAGQLDLKTTGGWKCSSCLKTTNLILQYPINPNPLSSMSTVKEGYNKSGAIYNTRGAVCNTGGAVYNTKRAMSGEGNSP